MVGWEAMLAHRLARGIVALGMASLIYSGGPPPAWAIAEADRLWLVGEHAFADRLYAVSRRALERFIRGYPNEARVGAATLLLGKSQFGLGEFEAALESFKRAQRLAPPPGRPEEARFWEGETLFRLKRYAEAHAVYDALLAANAAAPAAPDAMYGLAWADLELKRPEAAAAAFRQFLAAWPDSPLAPSATFYLARTLVELKKPGDAMVLLAPFASRYPTHPLIADVQYLLGWSRLAAGKTSEGLQDLREFVAAHPRHELALAARRAIADALLKGGTKAELAQEYQSLIAQSPPAAEGLYDAGRIAQQLGRQKDAEQAWRRLRTEFPKHALAPRASLDLAQAAFKRSQFKDAAALARPASESDDEAVRVEALLIVGESELKQRRFQPALKAFQTAAAAEGADLALRFRALAGSGLAHEGLGQIPEAARLYAEVAADSPDKALKQWAKERLAAVRAKSKPRAQPKAEKPKS
ncbi:MAG: tetratricopeptide repeat protein [Candidatus Rokubacteria bacterium]|nr:tetratricopeptide repeat protein [Candidatus Rokubacteria bacterium]